MVLAIDAGSLKQGALFEPERTLADRVRELVDDYQVTTVVIPILGVAEEFDLGAIPAECFVITEQSDLETPHTNLSRIEIGEWAIEALPGSNLTKPDIAPGGYRNQLGEPVFLVSGFTTWLPLFEGPNERDLPNERGVHVFACSKGVIIEAPPV